MWHSILLVPCPSFTAFNNGGITCSLGDDGVPSYEDTCSFTCDTGYVLTGSNSRTCQSDRAWSGSMTMCTRGVYYLYLYTYIHWYFHCDVLNVFLCLFHNFLSCIVYHSEFILLPHGLLFLA